MRNPLRSEADAFRFLLLTIGYFALIVIGAMINMWVGVGGVRRADARRPLRRRSSRGRDEPPPRVAPTARIPTTSGGFSSIANETLAGETLHAMIKREERGLSHERARRRAGAAVAAPALRLRRRSVA